MLFIYPAFFHKENTSYWAEFPDLPGCQTYGGMLSETVASAQEALAAYVLTSIEEGFTIPSPSDISRLSSPSDGFVSLVSAEIDPYRDTKAVKKTLTLPSWLNDRASALNINFSKVLQEALLSKINAENLHKAG